MVSSTIGCFAELAAGKGGLGHCAHEPVDRGDLRQVERFERNQPIFDGIVQIAVFPLASGSSRVPRVRMILRIAMIAVFQRKPPKPITIARQPTLQERC